MAKIYTFLADGFETVEALCVVDILRRAQVQVVTVSINETKEVISAQNITVLADEILDASKDYSDAEVVFLPGGMPGTINLENNNKVIEVVKTQVEKEKYICAICAAPSVFGHMGLLEGKRATCYPGFEKDLLGAKATGDKVVVDGKVITSKGMGTAVDLGLKLVEILCGEDKANSIGKGIQYT